MIEKYPDDPDYDYCNIKLMMRCAELVSIHTKEHRYPPASIMLSDEDFLGYQTFYKFPKEVMTFLGIPVRCGKA